MEDVQRLRCGAAVSMIMPPARFCKFDAYSLVVVSIAPR